MKTFWVIVFGVWLMVAASAQSVLPAKWQSPHYADNELVGKIFDSDGQEIIDERKWVHQLGAVNYLLLGEIHDNPDHHIIQAKIIHALANSGIKPAVVLEMVPQSYASILKTYDLTTDPQLNEFSRRLDWEERGWYSWDIYRPIGLAVAANRLTFVAGNLDRDLTRKISKNGLNALPDARKKELGLNADFPYEDLISELAGSHCGMMPKNALPAMAIVQRARDGGMAHALMSTPGQGILIAGNGHVRKDRGVPLVLRHLLPDSSEKTIVQYAPNPDTPAVGIKVRMPDASHHSIGIIEVSKYATQFFDYQIRNEDGEALYDYVIFTPKFDVTDHCAAFRKNFKSKQKTP